MEVGREVVKLAEPPSHGNHEQGHVDQRGHGIHSGEVEQQGDSIPDTEHDHGLLGADSVVNDANQPGANHAAQGQNGHDVHSGLLREAELSVADNQLAHDAHRADLEKAGGNGRQPELLGGQQFAGGPPAVPLDGVLGVILLLVDLVGDVVGVDATLPGLVADEDHTQNAQNNGGDADGDDAGGKVLADIGGARHGRGVRMATSCT